MAMRLTGCLVSLALLLTACGQDAGNTTGTGPASTAVANGTQSGTVRPADANTPVCSWAYALNEQQANIFYPDKYATYWVAVFPSIPGSRLRIEGSYPQARYFSYNVYDVAQRPVDHIADFNVEHQGQGVNPFAVATPETRGRYVAYVRPEPKPDRPEPATMYAARTNLPGGNDAPVNPVISLAYRVYLGEGDVQGGVELPNLTLETADGQQAPIGLSPCLAVPLVSATGPLNDALRDNAYQTVAPLPTGGAAVPEFFKFYSIPKALSDYFGSRTGRTFQDNPLTQDRSGGFLSNRDNAYIFAVADKGVGSAYVVRGRAPQAASKPHEAPNGSAQVRYWSLCTNEFFTQRFVDCLHDREFKLDADGFFTLIVADADQKPQGIEQMNGINFLPWGAYPDSVLIYRHMLPSGAFKQAIQNIEPGTPPAKVMGDYLPQITYCEPQVIAAAPNKSPAGIFEACKSSRK